MSSQLAKIVNYANRFAQTQQVNNDFFNESVPFIKATLDLAEKIAGKSTACMLTEQTGISLNELRHRYSVINNQYNNGWRELKKRIEKEWRDHYGK